MRGTDAHNQQLFDQSNVTCDTVHVQYGIASDDSQNDCTDDEPDSASSDRCRVSPLPCLVSTPSCMGIMCHD